MTCCSKYAKKKKNAQHQKYTTSIRNPKNRNISHLINDHFQLCTLNISSITFSWKLRLVALMLADLCLTWRRSMTSQTLLYFLKSVFISPPAASLTSLLSSRVWQKAIDRAAGRPLPWCRTLFMSFVWTWRTWREFYATEIRKKEVLNCYGKRVKPNRRELCYMEKAP